LQKNIPLKTPNLLVCEYKFRRKLISAKINSDEKKILRKFNFVKIYIPYFFFNPVIYRQAA